MVATMSSGVLAMSSSSEVGHRIADRGSTLVVSITIFCAVVGLVLSRGTGPEKTLALWLVFAGWPIGALVGSVWALVNGIRTKRIQYGIEFCLAVGAGLMLLWLVSQPR